MEFDDRRRGEERQGERRLLDDRRELGNERDGTKRRHMAPRRGEPDRRLCERRNGGFAASSAIHFN